MSSDPTLDAEAELERHGKAQDFELPADGAPSFGPVPAPAYASAYVSQERAPKDPSVGQLEDLYAAYPKLGQGEWKIRVIRKSPKVHRGCTTAGFIGELYERLSLDEFKDKYGGGLYAVAVMKPAGDGSSRTDFRQVKEIRFQLPGDPTLVGVPVAEDETMALKYDPRSYLPDPKVEIERLRIEQAEREREREERRRLEDKMERHQRERSNEVPSSTLDRIYDTVRTTVEDVKENNAAQLGFWHGEVERLRSELSVRDHELKDARERLVRAEADASNTNRHIETVAMRDQKERFEERVNEMRSTYERQIAELKDRRDEERRQMQSDHTAKVDQLTSAHRGQIEDITRRHDEERRLADSAQTLERERTREDARARIEQIERAKESELRQSRENYESRLEELRRTTEREITAIRAQTDSKIDAVKMAEGTKVTVREESSNMKLALIEAENKRLRDEYEAMRREKEDLRDKMEELRDKMHKDPVQAITEARELAKYGGMIDRDEAGPAEETLTQTLVGLAKQAFDTAPAVLEQITKARQQNQQQHAPQAQPPQQQQFIVQQPPRQMPAPRYQPPGGARPQQMGYQPPPAAPPMGGAYTPPPMGSVDYSARAPVPLAPPVMQVASPVQPGSATPFVTEGGPSEAPAIPIGPVMMTSDQAPPAPAADAAPQNGAPPANGAPADLPGLDGAAIIEFFNQLESAVTNRAFVSAQLFATGLVDRVGADVATTLLQRYKPSDIVETAQQLSKGESMIVTRDGQRYTEEMWRHAAARIQQLRQQGGVAA